MNNQKGRNRRDNIEELGNGRYRLYYTCGYYADGRQRRENRIVEAENRTEAKRQLDVLRGEFAKNRKSLRNKKQTLNEFAQYFLDIECTVNRGAKIKTVIEYRNKFKNHISPLLGHLQLQDISVKHIDKLIEALQQPSARKPPSGAKNPAPSKKPLSRETIRHCFRLLASMLQFAFEQELIQENPARRRKAPKVPKHSLPKFPPTIVDDLQIALTKEPMHYRAFLMTKIFSGCRESELFGLTWENVDFVAGTIFISQTRQYVSGGAGIVISPLPKNDTSVRRLTLPKKIIDLLSVYFDEQRKAAKMLGNAFSLHDFVFVNEIGNPMHPATLSEWMQRFCKRHNLIRLTSKDLRHLHATILGKSKIPIRNASSRLGHAKVSTTLDIYTHDFQDADALIAEKLNELVKL